MNGNFFFAASIYSIALPIGSFIASACIEQFGRLPTIRYPLLLTIAGWIITATGKSIPPLLIGRFLIGCSNSLIANTAQVYVSEISDPSLRGSFVNLGYILFSVGVLITYVLGALLHWRNVAWVSLTLPVISFMLLCKLPESPTWLVYHNRSDDAHKALLWLRGDATIAKRELDDLNKRHQEESNGSEPSLSTFLNDCMKPSTLRPIVIVFVFLTCLQATGTYMIVFYSVDILSALGTTVDGITMSVATSVARLVATIAFCFIYYVARRRKIYMASGLMSGFALAAAAIYIMCWANPSNAKRDFYVTITLITTYIVTNCGFLLARNVIAGEMLPARVRGRIVSYIYVVLNGTFFIWTKSFPYLTLYLGVQGIFILFAAANFAAAILTYFCVPETYQKSLGEIEDYFKDNNGWRYRGTRNTKGNQPGTA